MMGEQMRPEAADKKVKEILDEKQFARYKQISLQVEGPQAFRRYDVERALNLSDDQVDKIQEILEQMRPQGPQGGRFQGGPGQGGPGQGGPGGFPGGPQGGPGQGGPGGPQDGFGQGGPGQGGPGGFQGGPGGQVMPPMPPMDNQQRKKAMDKVTAVLTAEQKEKWTAMIGKAFDLRPPQPPTAGGAPKGDDE
jgi:hypothetical protein